MLLPVSLLLNLFLVAVIAGYLLRTHVHGTRAAAPLPRMLANADARLSSRDAAAFRQVLQRNESRYAQAERDLREARRTLRRQIAAEPYDPVAVRRDLAAWQSAWNRVMEGFSEPLVEALGQVSAEGRRKLVADRPRNNAEPGSP